MKIKPLTITIIAITILATASITSYKLFNNKPQTSSTTKQIVATYKDGSITLTQAQSELNKLILKNPNLKGLIFNNLNTSQKETIIKEIVLKEIAYKEAKKQKLHQTDDYKQALKLFETEILKQKLFLKLATDAKTEENLKKNYDKLVKELKKKKDIRISYIALKTEKEANSLHKILIKSPKSFADLAKIKSIDKEIAKKGGDLGFILEDSLPAEIIKQAKQLEKNKISKPFKLTDNKWIIIKLTDERPAVIAKFEEARKALSQSLSGQAIQDFISKAMKESNISITIQ
jgi:parvulin-like peptidyl-prolyl isomerase